MDITMATINEQLNWVKDEYLPWKIRHNELLVWCLANNLCEYKKFCVLFQINCTNFQPRIRQFEGRSECCQIRVLLLPFIGAFYLSVNRLYGFSEFLRPSLNVLQFLPHLDSLQNDWMPYFPFNWVSWIVLFVGGCLIYCTCFHVFPCQKLTVQCSAVQPGILISRLLLHMRGKYVASIIFESSASQHRGKTHCAWAQNLTSGQLFISGLVYKPIA